jgi:hypothetical protein
MEIAHRPIIHNAVFWFDQSVFVIKLMLFHTNITKITAKAKYNAIFMNG